MGWSHVRFCIKMMLCLNIQHIRSEKLCKTPKQLYLGVIMHSPAIVEFYLFNYGPVGMQM